MTRPKRIQRKRTAGWRMPEGTVYVGRPSRWGNPYKVGDPHPQHGWPMSATEAAEMFDLHTGVFGNYEWNCDQWEALSNLRGRDLACWCDLDQPCHADVLLSRANADAGVVSGA